MNRKLLLVIAQNESDCNELSSILGADYELIITTSYDDGMTLFEKNAHKLSAIILPINHTTREGLHCIMAFNAHKTHAQIIIYSEKEDIQTVIEGMKRGAHNFLSKPFTPQKVLQTLQHTLTTVPPIAQESYDDNYNLDFHQRLANLQEKLLSNSRTDIPLTVDEILSLFPISSHIDGLDLESFRNEIEKQLNTLEQPTTHNRILIIEDEDNYRELLKQFLVNDYSVCDAPDGLTALSIVQKDPSFDIILLDIFLPDIQGTELLSKIKAYCKDAEIIIVTAFELVDVAVKTFRDGAFDFITKPVFKQDLLAVIKHAQHKRFLKHYLPQIGEDLLQNHLSRETKITLLNELLETRVSHGNSIRMEDVYIFFPQLKQTYIPSDLTLPKSVMTKGIEQFIKELEQKVGLFNPVEDEA